MNNFPTRIPDCDFHRPALLDFFSFLITAVDCPLPASVHLCVFVRLADEKCYYLDNFQYLRKFLLFVKKAG